MPSSTFGDIASTHVYVAFFLLVNNSWFPLKRKNECERLINIFNIFRLKSEFEKIDNKLYMPKIMQIMRIPMSQYKLKTKIELSCPLFSPN